MTSSDVRHLTAQGMGGTQFLLLKASQHITACLAHTWHLGDRVAQILTVSLQVVMGFPGGGVGRKGCLLTDLNS